MDLVHEDPNGPDPAQAPDESDTPSLVCCTEEGGKPVECIFVCMCEVRILYGLEHCSSHDGPGNLNEASLRQPMPKSLSNKSPNYTVG